MKVVVHGHEYILSQPHSSETQKLVFRNNGNGADKVGTNNQEVLRALIDRVTYLDRQVPWHGTDHLLACLRMALTLHESRHIERLCEKGRATPEHVPVADNGHFSEYPTLLENQNEQR